MFKKLPVLSTALLGLVGAFVWFGVYYPNQDIMALVPFLYKWDDPLLFTNDIAFNGSSQRFTFGLFVLQGLNKIMPLGFATGLWIICSHVFLLLGLWLLFKVFAKESEAKSGIIILFLLLMICGSDAIIGKYYLQFHYWAPHYLAHPFIFISLFCMVTRRFWGMLLFLVAACFVHPLIGLQGTILCASVLLVNWVMQFPRNVCIAIIICICLGIVSFCLAIRSFDYSYVRISAFVRAPWHMIPQLDPVSIKKYVIVAFGFVVMGMTLCRSNEKSRSILTAGLIAIAGILFGIWNNKTFTIPALVMANPLELGPIIHGLFLCMSALLIVRIAQSNMPYLIILPLFAPHKLGFYYIILILAVYQSVIERLFNKSWMFQAWLAVCTFICAAGGAWLFFPNDLTPWRSDAHYAYAMAAGVIITVLLHWVQQRKYLSIVVIVPSCVVVFYLVYALAGGQCFWRIDLAMHPAEPTLIEAAQFIKSHSPKNSLVVHPPSISNFQYLSYRSSFVSFKTVPLSSDLLPEWFYRLQELRVYSKKINYRTLTSPVIGDMGNYYKLSGAEFVNLKAKYPDITYIVFDKRKGDAKRLKTVYQNAHFAICEPILLP